MKKQIKSKINDINQMLSELDLNEDQNHSMETLAINPKIDINKLDVVDVLHNILN